MELCATFPGNHPDTRTLPVLAHASYPTTAHTSLHRPHPKSRT